MVMPLPKVFMLSVQDVEAFMRQFKSFYRYLIAIRFEIAGLHLHRKGIFGLPGHYWRMGLIQQTNDDIPAGNFGQTDLVDPFIEIRITGHGASLECYMAELMHARLHKFRIFPAGAFTVFDRFHLHIKACYFSEANAFASPLDLEMKLWKWVCCHDFF